MRVGPEKRQQFAVLTDRQMLDPRFFSRDLLVELSEAGLRGSGLELNLREAEAEFVDALLCVGGAIAVVGIGASRRAQRRQRRRHGRVDTHSAYRQFCG